jgi:uncharacterized phage protein gp47/JayE
MGPYYNYTPEQGLVLPDTGTLLTDVETEWTSALGQDLILDPSTPQGRLIDAEVAARSAVLQGNCNVANQINPNNATGTFLQSICALNGINPVGATFSVIPGAVLSGAIGTLIPKGSRAATDPNTYWASNADVTLVDDGTGTSNGVGTADFTCTIAGNITADPATMNTIVDSINGWKTVTNPNQAIPGQNFMSDSELRLYRNSMLYSYGNNSVGAMFANINSNQISGVKNIALRENVEATQQVIDGVTLPPNSLWVCVDGGSDYDVARGALTSKSGGSKFSAGNQGTPVVQSVKDYRSGQSYSVTFVRPAMVPVTCRVRVQKNASIQDLEKSIRDAIVAYTLGQLPGEPGFVIGADVSPFELSGAAMRGVPGIYISDCLVALQGGTESRDPIVINIWQKAVLPFSSITVEVLP